jgi:thiol-disulfide isomerase/thioredoxin
MHVIYMKIKVLLLLCVLLLSKVSLAQGLKVIKYPELEELLSGSSDTTYVVNFWATWCGPCIKELPHFESLGKQYAQKRVKVLLVSLDFKKDLETKVKPFLAKRKIQSQVLLLDETDYNSWIDKITPDWSGSIPMTLIVNKTRNIRHFIDKEVNAVELETLLSSFNL